MQGQHGEGQSQGTGEVIGLGDAQGLPVVVSVGEQGVKGPKSPGGGAVRQGQGGQQGHQGGLGVVPLFRRGAVGVLPAAEDVDPWSLLLTGERDGLLQRQVPDGGFHGVQRQTQNRGLGLGRDHIQPGAAGEVRDPGQSLLLGPGSLKGGLIVPFFNVDDGEIGVGRDGIGGIGVPAVIPFHIPEPGFLVRAGDETDIPAQGDAQVFDRFHRQQGRCDRPLVVVGAAAIEKTVHQLGHKGLGDGPSLSRVYHVQVS